MNTRMGFPVSADEFSVDDLAGDLAVGLADDLVGIGFDWFPEASHYDGLFLFEAICSLLLKYQGLDHYLRRRSMRKTHSVPVRLAIPIVAGSRNAAK